MKCLLVGAALSQLDRAAPSPPRASVQPFGARNPPWTRITVPSLLRLPRPAFSGCRIARALAARLPFVCRAALPPPARLSPWRQRHQDGSRAPERLLDPGWGV